MIDDHERRPKRFPPGPTGTSFSQGKMALGQRLSGHGASLTSLSRSFSLTEKGGNMMTSYKGCFKCPYQTDGVEEVP